MLILILIDVQYLQKVVFCFEKGSNGQNHSSSASHHHIKKIPPLRGHEMLLEHPDRNGNSKEVICKAAELA